MKISIYGLGHVGSTLAYTLAMQGVGNELLLINRSRERADGEAGDLQHMQCLNDVSSSMHIRAGDIADSADSDIVVLACSVSMGSVASRNELGPANVDMFRSIVPQFATFSPDAIILVLSNPVDVLVWYTVQFSGFPATRVIGSGTLIDSARYRYLLSQEHAIHPSDVRAYILGEHGATQFAADSSATAGGERMDAASRQRSQELCTQAVQSGFDVYHAKGYTNYAVAMAATLVIKSIVYNEHRTMPLSIAVEDYYGVSDVCLSVPVVVGVGGIERVLKPALDAHECRLLAQSAAAVRVAIDDSERSYK